MVGIIRKTHELVPNSIWDQPSVVSTLKELGIKEKHARTMWRYLLRNLEKLELHESGKFYKLNPIKRFDLAGLGRTVPQRMAEQLQDSGFVFSSSELQEAKVSEDGHTTKMIVKLQNGKLVETVIMHYDQKYKSTKPRNTVCLSSQVGCKMACTFCATGTMGLAGNLHAAEIIEQLVHACRIQPIRNVVFMGMGEPLDNYDNVVEAIRVMIDHAQFCLAPGHICVSTVGVIPKMNRLLSDMPRVKLALSLHAPTQELRMKIVPTSRAWPLHRLMKVLDDINTSGDRVMIEYILIRDVNDTVECAHLLGNLLHGKDVMVNLIPYNPTDVPHDYKAPLPEQPAIFENIIRSKYDIRTTVRRTMGQDISGACGQLVIQSEQRPQTGSAVAADIEDLLSQVCKVEASPISKVPPSETAFNTRAISLFIIILISSIMYKYCY